MCVGVYVCENWKTGTVMNWNSYWLWTGEMPLCEPSPYQMATLQLAWIRIGKQHCADY